MLPLRCAAQNYEWGRDAASSEVAQLARANGHKIDESKPYAELWMGTHPNCPSEVAATGESLQQWIEAHPECLGSAVRRRFGTALPFLFKVLSVNKALSIQSHPNKQLAEQLHRDKPKLYPDDNHKPELALALSRFEVLCGFCPQEELQAALRAVPELRECMGETRTAALLDSCEPNPQALKTAFTVLMTCEPSTVQQAVQRLVQRLQRRQQQQQHQHQRENGHTQEQRPHGQRSGLQHAHGGVQKHDQEQQAQEHKRGQQQQEQEQEQGQGQAQAQQRQQEQGRQEQDGQGHERQQLPMQGQVQAHDPAPERHEQQAGDVASRLADKEELALRLNTQFPGDVGVLSSFFFNLVRLEPGQAVFLPANVPHAYLDGEIVECMAASDNVIRAGLTPKFKDVAVLCDSLLYEQGLCEVLEGRLLDNNAMRTGSGSVPGRNTHANGEAGAPSKYDQRSDVSAREGSHGHGGQEATSVQAQAKLSCGGQDACTGGASGRHAAAETAVRVYQPSCEEFEIQAVQVASGQRLYLPCSPGPSLLLVQHGRGSAEAEVSEVLSGASGQQERQGLARGTVLFVPAETRICVCASGNAPLVLWVAAVNSALLRLGDELRDSTTAKADKDGSTVKAGS